MSHSRYITVDWPRLKRVIDRELRKRFIAGALAGLILGLLIGRVEAATPRPAPGSAPVTSAQGQTEAPQSLTPADRTGVGSTPRAGASGERTPGGASPSPVLTDAPPPSPGRPPSPLQTQRPLAAAGGHAITGTASWYCSATSACTKGYPASGLSAAAGPALRDGAWRGRLVTITSSTGRQVTARLIDWCQCPGGRVIDLYASAFSRLAPLSAGVVKVTVRW